MPRQLLLAACLLIPGCPRDSDITSATPAQVTPAPVPEGEIEILLAGKPPLHKLRFVAPARHAQTVNLHYTFRDLGLSSVEGLGTLQAVPTATQAAPPWTHALEISAVEDTKPSAVGVGSIEFAPRGFLAHQRADSDPSPYLMLLRLLRIALPEAAVGEGAMWTVVRKVPGSEGMVSRTTYTLTEVTNAFIRVKLSSKVERHNPHAEQAVAPLHQLGTRTDAELWWNLNEALPYRATAETTTAASQTAKGPVVTTKWTLGPREGAGGW